MANIWIISDTHFGHKNMAEVFLRTDGTKVRPFATVQEMDEQMIALWNAVVRPADHVWHLGDFAIPRGAVRYGLRLLGHKRLIRGNHDMYKTKEYLAAGFEEIRGLRGMSTDIPMKQRPMARGM